MCPFCQQCQLIIVFCVIFLKTWIIAESWIAGTGWAVISWFFSDLLFSTNFTPLLGFVFFLCWWNGSNEMPFCQASNGLLSWNLWSVFCKEQRCNYTPLEIQQWLSSTILFVQQKAIQEWQLNEMHGKLLIPLHAFPGHFERFEELISAINSTHVMIVIHNTLWLLNWACRVPPISYILHPFIMNSRKNVNLPGVFELESQVGIRSISNNIDFPSWRSFGLLTAVTVSLDRQKDMLWNSSMNPTYLFKNN